MKSSTVIMFIQLLMLVLLLVSSSAQYYGPLESLRHQFQSNQGVSLFNITAVETEECREDLEHWIFAMETFVNAMELQCAANDTSCIAVKGNLTADNMFAVKQLDSFGRIPSNLLNFNNLWQGSWEECMAVESPSKKSYKTQFCWQKIATPITLQVIPDAKRFSLSMCDMAKYDQVMASWSTCMPRSCTDRDITLLFQSLNSLTPENSSLYMFCNNECRPTGPPKKDGGFWVMIVIMGVAGILMIMSSLVDYLTDYPDNKFKRFRSGIGIRCLLAFSVYTNAAELLSVVKRPGQIDSLHCIRVFSMTWVMVGHVLIQYMFSDNISQMMKDNRYFLNSAFTNAFFSVDSFLFLGGLLLTFLFLKDIHRKPSTLKSGSYWFLYYLHRILRLSPPYWLFLGFTVVFFDFLTVGPTKMTSITTVSGCRKSWWRNVLYVNNLFDLENMCMGHAWYLALDMQIHVFAPLFLVPLALHVVGGIVSGIILIAISTALNYWAYYKWDLPATLMGFLTHALTMDLSESATFQQYIYFASWIRYTPYIIGGWTGWFLFYMRKNNRKIRIHWMLVIILWICAVLIGIGCVYGLYDYTKGNEISLFGRASYYNWSRIGWSFALAWVVIACEQNLAGPVKTFMEQGFWAPFSRLTYCAYLTHFILISIIFAMSRQPMHFVSMTHVYIVGALPVFVVSYAVSFVWSCAFEIPSMKLEKMLIAAFFGGGAPRHRELLNDKLANPPGVVSPKQKIVEEAWTTNEKGQDGHEKVEKQILTNNDIGEKNGSMLRKSALDSRPAIAPKPTIASKPDMRPKSDSKGSFTKETLESEKF